MVPVKLTLSNFLSYGSEAQVLDFQRFHVACLSGKNGQGKSALLDALTWALWGEARKSSGAQKPDEELLRIGSRRMFVEFIFDIEGDRYRVIRGYSRSVSGKTSKSELELQIIDPETDEGIPLTQPSMRETQETLNERLGLDYDAFVNSALLLQGRSDEFTKKRPAERKNILGRVLNLGKYDRLADRARLRQNELKTESEKLQREVEIFSDVLENEKKWKSDFKEAETQLIELEQSLGRLREEESKLLEEVVLLQSLEKELDSLNAIQHQSEQQKKMLDAELRLLISKIDEAHAVILRKDQIQDDYQLYTSFQKERDELDIQREVFRGIEAQLQVAKSSLALKKNELESTIEKHELELRVKEQEYADIGREVSAKNKIIDQLKSSRAAVGKVREFEETLQRRVHLDADIKELEQQIFGEKKQLTERFNGYGEQLDRVKVKVSEIGALRKSLEELAGKRKELEHLQQELVDIRENGLALGESISKMDGRISIAEKELERVKLQIDQLKDTVTSKCPTCGTVLERQKRASLLDLLVREKIDIEGELANLIKELEKESRKRENLRNQYKKLNNKEREYSEVLQLFHQTSERLEKNLELKNECDAVLRKKQELKDKLAKDDFALHERKALIAKRKQREDLVFDENELKKLRFEAAQIDRFEERLRKIEFAEGKRENLETQLEKNSNVLLELRHQLDKGDAFNDLRKKITTLEEKLIQCNFDHERFEFVKKGIRERSEIPELLRVLLEAENNVGEWEGQRKQMDKVIADILETIQNQKDKIVVIAESLSKLDGLKNELKEKKENREEIEKAVLASRQSIGKIKARLEQADEAKEKRKAARGILKDMKAELNIFRKLRTAFGKNGIQSLIIEQALPEIEERASEILYRLTDGKMQVHLETIKDKKSGGTKETLEIIITDDQGVPRAYETYSGGEAFRINFALRIALSQMLAERNGVKIRTLGIDEGFGTQDEEGIQYLIEAIQEVQDDFDKILVITHLKRLKEAFPVRIEVVKDPIRGSEFTLFEQ